MIITVFGASGGVGRQFIDLATARGHAIRDVYRTAPHVAPRGQVEVLVSPDIFNPAFVAQAIRGADVVVTALGPAFARPHNAMSAMKSPPDLHQRLARTLITAIKGSGSPPKVIAVSTGSASRASAAAMGLGPRLLFGFFLTVVARNLRLVGKDLEAMEQELAAGGLDWYAVRPVKLTDGPLTGCVQAGDQFAMKSISRADVAWYMLTLAEDPEPRSQRTPILMSAQGRLARSGVKGVAEGRLP
jgi:putative NADH-flavin reductase